MVSPHELIEAGVLTAPAGCATQAASLKSFGWALLRVWAKLAAAPLSAAERRATLHARILWLSRTLGFACRHRQPVVYTTPQGGRVDGRLEYVLRAGDTTVAVEVDLDGAQPRSLYKLVAHPGARLWVVLDSARTKEEARRLRSEVPRNAPDTFILHLVHGWV